MPQMAPMNWFMLNFYFLILFIMINIIIYFYMNNYMNKNKFNFKKIFNPKW